MSSLTKEQVEHIAKLARLSLTPAEAEKMAKELSSILQYIEMLNEVPTDSVKPTAQVTGLSTVLREDVIVRSEAAPDALLACSPLPMSEHQIQAPHAHG
jgi:aspartyl-tRNA(Asn)/glutamyl-tRNA(Gln) amidotransferase subunit C